MARVNPFRHVKELFKAPESPAPRAIVEERWARPLSFSGVQLDPAILAAGSLYGVGGRVTRAQAMRVPAVKRVRDLVAGTLGSLRPRVIDGKRRTVPWDLIYQPENDIARSVTMTNIFDDMLFHKHSWLRITEFDANGWPAKVRRLEFDSVTVQRNGRVYTRPDGNAQGQALEWVPDSQLIRIDSPNDALLEAGADAIRICLLLMGQVGEFAREPLPMGYFTPKEGAPGLGDRAAVDAMLDEWADARARRRWHYIDDELDAKTLTWNPEQLQLQGLWDNAVLEIARIGGVDPEELGVSTTSRTYANSEQRRLDLIDFTLLAYVTAVEDRIRMPDITPPGYELVYDYAGFLRSDTKSRLETYEIGLRVGTHTPKRIAEIERLPVEDVKPQKPTAPPVTAPIEEKAAAVRTSTRESATFSDTNAGIQFSFVGPAGPALDFKANAESRTLSGMLVPWNTVAYSRGYQWKFAPGSLHWSEAGRVKLDRNHEYGGEFGRATELANTETGLVGRFSVARGVTGDDMLGLAQDGVFDGFSVEVHFSSQADGWTADPDNPDVRIVHSGTLFKVALTATPAYDDARVTSVAATKQEGQPMDGPGATTQSAVSTPPDLAAFTAGLTTAMSDAITAAVEAALARLPQPQGVPARDPNAVVQAASGITVTREAPVYLMNGHGPSFVRDAWKARTEGDHEAAERLRKFSKQTSDMSVAAVDPTFAVNTGNASGVIPPGYRPDLFVTQLMQGRPLVNSVSRGTLSDATPFNIPAWVSSSNATSTHVEGTNPTGGTLVLGVKTVAPTAISGLYELTREIVDSANPAIDAIAVQAMQESYSQQTEALVYARLNGTDGQGGVITSGFVPSGAQVTTTTGQGDELLDGVRGQMALYPFRRFGQANRAHISQEATVAFANAKDTTGRPLLPFIGAQNAVGTTQSQVSGYNIDGLIHVPTWSMTGNAAGDSDVMQFNSADVWAWESGLLMFRFEERNGPARIDLALFGYFATQVLRPVGISSVRHTAA